MEGRRPPSQVAQQFKLCVLQAMEESDCQDNNNVGGSGGRPGGLDNGTNQQQEASSSSPL
jgi:hypothetical protein